MSAERLPNVYVMNVPWFREDSSTTVGWVPSAYLFCPLRQSSHPLFPLTCLPVCLHWPRSQGCSTPVAQTTAPTSSCSSTLPPTASTGWRLWHQVCAENFWNVTRNWTTCWDPFLGLCEDFITQSSGTGEIFLFFFFSFNLFFCFFLIECCFETVSCVADSEVLWCHCASVHSCNSPPGLWGAAVLHLGVRWSPTNEPCGGKRPAAPQNQPDCLYSALPAQVDQSSAEVFSITVSSYLESLSVSFGSQKFSISYFFPCWFALLSAVAGFKRSGHFSTCPSSTSFLQPPRIWHLTRTRYLPKCGVILCRRCFTSLAQLWRIGAALSCVWPYNCSH